MRYNLLQYCICLPLPRSYRITTPLPSTAHSLASYIEQVSFPSIHLSCHARSGHVREYSNCAQDTCMKPFIQWRQVMCVASSHSASRDVKVQSIIHPKNFRFLLAFVALRIIAHGNVQHCGAVRHCCTTTVPWNWRSKIEYSLVSANNWSPRYGIIWSTASPGYKTLSMTGKISQMSRGKFTIVSYVKGRLLCTLICCHT